jgi:hypothetical protein
MSWFHTPRKPVVSKSLPQTYRPEMQANEVIDLFGRLTLHHQAALMRLISRNTVVDVNGSTYMGYEFDYEVEGAVITMSENSSASD